MFIFRTRYYHTPDGKYGSLVDKNGTFNGIIGEVQKGTVADVAMTAMSVIADRARAAELGTPFTLIELVYLLKHSSVSMVTPSPLCRYRLFYKSLDAQSSDSVDWYTYTSPFKVTVWPLFLSFCIIFFLAFLMANMFNQINSSWITAHAMLCQGYPQDPVGKSGQLLFLLAFLFGLLSMFHYSAVLMSFLAIQKAHVPFTNLETMLSNTNYKVALRSGAIQEAIFKVFDTNNTKVTLFSSYTAYF